MGSAKPHKTVRCPLCLRYVPVIKHSRTEKLVKHFGRDAHCPQSGHELAKAEVTV